MIDYTRKIVVLHPPKTGGISLQQALGQPTGRKASQYFARWRHDTLEDVWGLLPELREWPVYLLVRNPFARVVSYYHYLAQTQFRREFPIARYVRGFVSCEQFLDQADLESLHTHANARRRGALEPCAYYAMVDGEYQGQVIPLHTERLTEDARMAFGIDQVPVINASDHRDWRIYYTPERRRRVAEYMREDFLRFGYEEDE